MADDPARQRAADDGEVEAAFAEIIANWHRTAAHGDDEPPSATPPAEQGSNSLEDVHEPPPAPTEQRPRTVEEVFGPAGATGWRTYSPPPDPEDETFVPPDPEPPPGHDIGFWGALLGVVGGPLMLVTLAVFAPGAYRIWFYLAIAATFAGFALLIARLPARRSPEDDDEDNGAVV